MSGALPRLPVHPLMARTQTPIPIPLPLRKTDDKIRRRKLRLITDNECSEDGCLRKCAERSNFTAFEMWWHTRRNQILSFGETNQFKSAGASVQSTTGSRGVRISGSNAGYTMFRGSVKGTGYPLHSPVSPSHTLPWVTVCHHISTGLYNA